MRHPCVLLAPGPASARWCSRRGRRELLAALAWAASAALAACTKKDFSSELDRVDSWTATTRLAADRRRNGATNAAVTSQLADRAVEASVEAEQSFAKLATSDSERTAARAALDSLRQGIIELDRVNR
jgi:hypothetical protein